MDEQQNKQRTRLWIGLGAVSVLIIAACCGLAIWLVMHSPTPVITAGMQQTADQALLDPDSAPIDLGSGYPDWYPPTGRDFAVESGLVIFPQPEKAGRIQDVFNSIIDKYMPALVYAPDGRSLPADPNPPHNQSWYYIGEWYLYACTPLAEHPHWWRCMLLVGGNI